MTDLHHIQTRDRLEFVIKEEGFDNPKQFAESLGFKRPEIVYKVLRGENLIGPKLAKAINKKYDKYPIEWLRFGSYSHEVKGYDTNLVLNKTLLESHEGIVSLAAFLADNHEVLIQNEAYRTWVETIINIAESKRINKISKNKLLGNEEKDL